MIKTLFLKVNAVQPENHIIRQAAEYIQAGGLVAFPTETVYGLGADAFQPEAVDRIFQVKGRPPENALLVHVSNQEQVHQLTPEVPPAARKLMDKFWPGPLSIILPSLPGVPAIVRGGKTGVGLRMPSHPVALALINMTGPLAAPSANLYRRPSPTNAEHVRQDLDGKIPLVLDGGETGAGLESTLVDMSSGSSPRLLRLGGISEQLIEACLGEKIEREETAPSYYKTKVKIILTHNKDDFAARIAETNAQGRDFGVVSINGYPEPTIDNSCRNNIYLDMSKKNLNLYAIIRAAEAKGMETLVFAPMDPDQAGAAMMDRLQRAAASSKV